MKFTLIIVGIFFSMLGISCSDNITVKSITLTSPDNSAMLEDIKVALDKPASLFVKYWEPGSKQVYSTVTSPKKSSHLVHLLLLKPNTTYEYKVVVDGFINASTRVASFHTRKLGPWMIHDWIKKDKPHDPTALGKGLVMLCNGGLPGYVAMVDGKGDIRWYWQTDSIGVRAATLTPRGTILLLLHPPGLDEINDVPDKAKVAKLNDLKYPIRRGRIGYTGGTSFAEISPAGRVLWKVNINKDSLGYLCIHHEIRMDDDHNILTFIRDPLPYDMSGKGGSRKDTLWGDALVKLDTTGKILWKWSPWHSWDFKDDKKLNMLSYDRFHFNALWITKDSNYLISSAIENQIWKIDAKTGKIIWKLGKGGSFKMNPDDYFYFQHDVNITSSGDIMIFDNGDSSPFDTVQSKLNFTGLYAPSEDKISRVLAFHLDMKEMDATARIKIALPQEKYSSRMGSAYELPDDRFLVTSSKTGAVFIVSLKGKILWELKSDFIPYRAEYVPDSFWDAYFSVD